MRTIKFRAWDTEEKKMYEWDNGQGFQRADIWLHFVTVFAGYPRWIIMQFTGLHDKNGEEIYEGDIVKEEFNHGWCNCEIVYDNAGFFIKNEEEEIEDNLHWHVNGLEIIGNLYENPDLIK